MADDAQNEHDDDDSPVSIPAKDLKALRSIARDFQDLKQQSEAAQRQLAFAKAKIDITDPKMSYFVKGYDGELEPEKIREAAVQAGFVSTERQVSAGEYSGHQALTDASAGGSQQDEDLEQKIRNAKSQEEVMAIMTAAGYPTSWNRQ